MVIELEKAQVTELYVRMDCNGCVQRIKRALHGLEGVYEVYIDITQQKLTVVGRAAPEKIIKAVKKTRKTATICSDASASNGPSSSEPAPATSTEPKADTEQASTADREPPAAPPENPPPAPETKEADPASPAEDANKDVDQEDIRMVHHYPHGNFVYREHWINAYREPFPHYVTHSYNSYRPSASIARRPEVYGDGYNGGGQIASLFSDENPNACSIV
ncbi:Heavy metal-associated isoprenylated plant protein 26 [Apostasia shenzhenica]|uniref:Heavy metal-associated isoprenylated plant protein 26 n=1 Tax=Apostasia shenzhenica TaxID=1088818 RepID=A0A2I0AS88_9ASPA|nr:Heavy metal-associated isoprenylated plant protein 26 [Apostasia shenzhenica]